MKAVIIDDEESARNRLQGLLTTFAPQVEVLADFLQQQILLIF